MKELYKDFLFTKHVLVNDYQESPENVFEVLFSFANLFGIKIVKGKELACKPLLVYASLQLGQRVPKPFYLGFPDTVRELTPEQLLFDQLVHYAITYGFGDFENPGHSIFEKDFERTAFKENCQVKEFDILTEKEAEVVLFEAINDLLSSSRPLSDSQYEIVLSAIEDYKVEIEKIPCKDTVIRLIFDTQNFDYAKYLRLPDFIKFVELYNFHVNKSTKVKKLNLKNQDRKMLTRVLDTLLEGKSYYVKECFEKQQLWCGILHHIHYKPKNEKAEKFVSEMRNGKNCSAFSEFEKAMANDQIEQAVELLIKEKGTASLLRKVNYVLSRCKTEEQIEFVLSKTTTKNSIVLMQLMIQYSNYRKMGARDFKFPRFNRLIVHKETEEETASRKSNIPEQVIDKIVKVLKKNLESNLSGKLGKVYVGEDMKKIAIPLQENTSMGGFGTLPKGSRVAIPEGKKIRAFTYWEKVNDIDLSIIGIDDKYERHEFSWRTMWSKQSTAMTFSGDQTSGYNGGSEYFDLDVEKLKKLYPQMRYYILCDNVFSRIPFDKCFCKAGFMVRDVFDSGEVFEPKTVQTSYLINCASTFAYMFAIDAEKREMVWLNIARESNEIIAAVTDMSFLIDYVDVVKTLNMHYLFTSLATEIVDNPLEADYVVTDEKVEIKEGATLIRSYDTDKVLPFINDKT